MLCLLTMKIAVNLAKAPEEKTARNGRVYWAFRAADNQKNGNEQKTLWFQVSYFGDDEALVSTLQVGDRVELDGVLDARPYERRDGTYDPGLSVACFELKKLPKRAATNGGEEPDARSTQGKAPATQGSGSSHEARPSDDMDDDIPF